MECLWSCSYKKVVCLTRIDIMKIRQFVFSLLASRFGSHQHSSETPQKSIAIIGAGSAGLAALKTFLDLPSEIRETWDIILYEQRRDVGGIW